FASIGMGYWSGAGTALCRSEDGGDTWTIVSAIDYSTYQGWYSHGVGMHPDDPDEIICYGIELWKSTTGGTALEQKTESINVHGTPDPGGPEGPPDYVHVDMHALEYHPHSPDTFYIATDGGVFRSLDRGETFQACNGGYQTTQFYNGFSSAATDSQLAMGGFQDNYSAIYSGSVAWRRVLYGDGCWTAINPTDPDILFGSSQWLGGLYKSVDGGANWATVAGNLSGTSCFVTPFMLCNSDPDVMYAGFSYIYRSDDAGHSWHKTNNNLELDGNPALSLAASWYNSDVVYAGTAPSYTRAGLFRTTNGGESWVNITGELPDRYPVDIAVDPANHSNVYVVFSGFGTSHIYNSTDGGESWQDIGGSLPDVPTSAVIVDPWYTDHIYVGNDLGVYVSRDGGGSWMSLQEGLPDAIIAMDLSISPTNRKLRVATHGNGAYQMPLLNPTGVEQEQQTVPANFELFQNYPNPFNATTTISYRTSEAGMVHLAVYNVAGQLVEALVDEYKEAGRQTVKWDAKNVASAIYLYRLTAGEHTLARKCVIVR
ncbi:T9SS type A sorting domain-containing protein, partial [Candidatus Zixiibacteriota bacterium]